MMTTTGSEDEPDHAVPGQDAPADASVVDGRYQLLKESDAPRGSQFWRAYDLRLDRVVSVNLIELSAITPTIESASTSTSESVDVDVDAIHRFSHDTSETGDGGETHVARVYDVIALDDVDSRHSTTVGDGSSDADADHVSGSGQIAVVAEWVPGQTLAEWALTRIPPREVVCAVRGLAADTAAAHRLGHHLPLDFPGRVRVRAANDPQLVLAYPSTLATASDDADVRGLGAILYTLLTGTWPLGDADTTQADLPPAARDGDQLRPPHRVRSDIDSELSALTMTALGESSAAALSAQELVEALDTWDVRNAGPLARADSDEAPTKRRRLSGPVGVAAMGVVMVLGLGVIGWGVGSGSSSPHPVTPINADLLASPAGVPQSDGFSPTGATVIIRQPQGRDGDQRTVVELAPEIVDGDSSTFWSTGSSMQYPRETISVIVTFPVLADIRDVWLDSSTPGMTVEVRTVVDESDIHRSRPVRSLLLGAGTAETAITRIPLRGDTTVDRLEIRITGLAPTGAGYRGTLYELGFTGRS
ncbi:MAG: hypothetical protein GX542_13260 [Rhodococcus sp.]|nr:hypothetical protein [Rhodococcus sp. (in: high G+C Gram-positive bacteria)]